VLLLPSFRMFRRTRSRFSIRVRKVKTGFHESGRSTSRRALKTPLKKKKNLGKPPTYNRFRIRVVRVVRSVFLVFVNLCAIPKDVRRATARRTHPTGAGTVSSPFDLIARDIVLLSLSSSSPYICINFFPLRGSFVYVHTRSTCAVRWRFLRSASNERIISL